MPAYPSDYGIIHPLDPKDIGPPPIDEDNLGISGISFAFYEVCRTGDEISISELIKELKREGHFKLVETSHTYEGIFSESYLREHPSVLLEFISQLEVEHALSNGSRISGLVRVFLNVHESGIVLLYGVFTLSSRFFLNSGFTIRLDGPLRTAEILEFIGHVYSGRTFKTKSGPKTLHDFFTSALEQLYPKIQNSNKSAVEQQSARGFAVQIWDIEEYAPDDIERFDVIEFVKNNCWDISAILDADLELIYNRDFWRRRNKANVFSRLRTAFAVLNNHLVYATPRVCLEITLINPRAMKRSLERLEKYGYDSTSIFLWSVVLTQEFLLRLHNDRIDVLLGEARFTKSYLQLVEKSSRLKQDVIRDLEGAYWIDDELREERHVTLWRYMSEHKGIDTLYRHMSRKLRYISDVSSDMSDATAQNKQSELLTTLRDVTLTSAASASGLYILNLIVAAALSFQLVDFISRNWAFPSGQSSILAGIILWVILSVLFHLLGTLATKRETSKLGGGTKKNGD